MKKDLFKSCIALLLAAGMTIGGTAGSLFTLTASAEELAETETISPTEESTPYETEVPSETEEVPEATTPVNAEIERIAVKKLPDKCEYVVGQKFDATGMVVQAYWSDGSVSTIEEYTCSSPDTNTIGKKDVTVTYRNWSASFYITVVNRAVLEYQYTPPVKDEYFQGEKFDTTGLSLTILYNDGITETPEVSFDEPDMSQVGEHQIQFRWKDHSEWFQFNVVMNGLEKLTLSGKYMTSYAIGDELDLTGLVVTAHYANGTSEVVTDYTISAFDSTLEGDQEITITYGGKRATLTVSVGSEQPFSCIGGTDCPSKDFTDVATSKWYHEGIDYVVSHQYMVGISASRFAPNQTTTRGMIVTILWRIDGSPAPEGANEFTDVRSSAWYGDAVLWASQNGIVSGYGNGKFGPNDTITREQLAAMLFRYAKYLGQDTSARSDLSGFPDYGSISGWAKEALSWAHAEGLIIGIPQTDQVTQVQPQGNATRAQAAAVIYRFADLY